MLCNFIIKLRLFKKRIIRSTNKYCLKNWKKKLERKIVFLLLKSGFIGMEDFFFFSN